MHDKKFKFTCKKCSYGTDNQDCLTSHRINKHKEKFVIQSGKKVEFKCKLCYKVFGAPHLLRKHERTVECTAEKILPCPDCGKMFKTQEGLEYHKQQQHQGQKSPCPTCGKMVAEKSMPNHMKIHSGQRALQWARDFKAKAERRKRAFFFSSSVLAKRKVIARKKAATSKSAPAKIRRSLHGRKAD